MRVLSFTLIILLAYTAFAQFPVGHRELSANDPARGNRNVGYHIYYPAATAGDNTAAASGSFPFIVFGHGFVMGYDAYLYWKNELVPDGYILVFPTTESGTSPSHAEFAADLNFLAALILTEGSNSSSFLYQKVNPQFAVAGHSMGGGAAFLACSGNALPSCILTFAAAETNPSAITAAAGITIPALVLSGDDDCVTPPANHQLPMYNALSSSCKAHISIKDGVHCYFGDYNFACTLGESTCNPVPGIQRAAQLATALVFVKPFLGRFLKNDMTAWQTFTNAAAVNTDVTAVVNCNTSEIELTKPNDQPRVYPNPAMDFMYIHGLTTGEFSLHITDVTGKLISSGISYSEGKIDVSALPAGFYQLHILSSGTVYHCSFLKQ